MHRFKSEINWCRGEMQVGQRSKGVLIAQVGHVLVTVSDWSFKQHCCHSKLVMLNAASAVNL